MSRNHIPQVINARSIWHWAHVEPSVSIMAVAMEASALAGPSAKRQGSRSTRLNGNWSNTKAGHNSRGGFSDNSAAIWWEQQRMDVRAVTNQLPFYALALGRVLYAEFNEQQLKQVHSHLYREVMNRVREQFPKMPPERRAKLRDLVYCALCHYHQAISPNLDGSPVRSMQPDLSQLKHLMAERGSGIETRRWGRQWQDVWDLIIDTIRDVDRDALTPVEDWIQRYFEKRQRCVV